MSGDARRLMNEAPTVVGLVTSVIESGGSLDGAVRAVADEGPPLSAELFRGAVREVDTKGSRSISDALTAALSGLREEAAGYRQAMMLCISAADAGDPAERLRILREASDVALDAVRIMGEKYSAGLSTPCMAVFGLGIMAPMILMSILPMMGIGGMFGAMPLDSRTVLVCTLVLIPLAILALSYHIRSGNPFLRQDGTREGLLCGLPLLMAVPLYAVMSALGREPEEALLLSVAPSAVCCLILLFEGRRRDAADRRAEEGIRDCVFELGNALLGGDNFERVVVSTISSRPECAGIGTSLSRELDLCRGDVCAAIGNAVAPVSREASRTLCDIQRCSVKDTEDAGRLAIAVGRQFQNESNIRKELDLRLKSMTDMMLGTATVFAPMVLGLSVSMLGPLSEISGYVGMEGTEAVLAVYLVELCALIAVLTSSLGDGEGVRGMIWRFCLMVPVALAVFRLCTWISLRRGYPARRDASPWSSAGGSWSPQRRCPSSPSPPLSWRPTGHPTGRSAISTGPPVSSTGGGRGTACPASSTPWGTCSATRRRPGASC